MWSVTIIEASWHWGVLQNVQKDFDGAKADHQGHAKLTSAEARKVCTYVNHVYETPPADVHEHCALCKSPLLQYSSMVGRAHQLIPCT